MAPTLAHCARPLPPEGAAAPADWQSQIRGPGWVEENAHPIAVCGSCPEGAAAPTDWRSQIRGPCLKRKLARMFVVLHAALHTAFIFLGFGVAFLLGSVAHAESVALAGMLGSQALLVIDGTAPKTVAVGQTHLGVKVVSTTADEAVVEQAGKRRTLRVGEAPVNMGGSASGGGKGNRIVLMAGNGGHFMTVGQINGKAVQFMVDTGATSVAMGAQDAERVGINYKTGQPVNVATANGNAQGYRVKLASVRVGDVEVFEVDAVVTPQAMPFMLLGNSFLTRFAMTRENDQMTLVKRY